MGRHVVQTQERLAIDLGQSLATRADQMKKQGIVAIRFQGLPVQLHDNLIARLGPVGAEAVGIQTQLVAKVGIDLAANRHLGRWLVALAAKDQHAAVAVDQVHLLQDQAHKFRRIGDRFEPILVDDEPDDPVAIQHLVAKGRRRLDDAGAHPAIDPFAVKAHDEFLVFVFGHQKVGPPQIDGGRSGAHGRDQVTGSQLGLQPTIGGTVIGLVALQRRQPRGEGQERNRHEQQGGGQVAPQGGQATRQQAHRSIEPVGGYHQKVGEDHEQIAIILPGGIDHQDDGGRHAQHHVGQKNGGPAGDCRTPKTGIEPGLPRPTPADQIIDEKAQGHDKEETDQPHFGGGKEGSDLAQAMGQGRREAEEGVVGQRVDLAGHPNLIEPEPETYAGQGNHDLAQQHLGLQEPAPSPGDPSRQPEERQQ